MAKFDTYREAFPNAHLSRKPNGVLEVALHTDGGKLLFNGHTHEQFVHLFHAIGEEDRKSTRLNSSHEWISYAVFCLKKKKKKKYELETRIQDTHNEGATNLND